MFGGVIVDLPTPFQSNGRIDSQSFQTLVERQLNQPISGILIGGITGEGETLNSSEHLQLLEHAIGIVEGNIPVLAALYWQRLPELLEIAKRLRHLAVDGVVVFLPAGSRWSTSMLHHQLQLLHQKLQLPIILAEQPFTRSLTITPEMLEALCQNTNLVAYAAPLVNIFAFTECHKRCHQRLTLFVLNEKDLLPALSLGASGMISVLANWKAEPLATIVQGFRSGENQKALRLFQQMLPLFQLGAQVHPAVLVKSLFTYQGIAMPYFRLPLELMPEAAIHQLLQEMESQASGW